MGVDLRAFDDDPALAAVVVERMVTAGVAVSDERPETIRDLPAPPPGGYLMWRLEPTAVMDGWDEWASWVVLDPDGVPVGTIDESHELVAHDTWGPATYTASYNPAGHDGPPPWHQTGFLSPEEAYAALLAALRPEDGDWSLWGDSPREGRRIRAFRRGRCEPRRWSDLRTIPE